MEQKNNQIETLRAAAIGFVLLSHFPVAGPWFAEASRYVELWSGVDLFFVISGFLITASLTRLRAARADRALWLPELKAFWIRRAFRLLPAAWLWLLIPLLLSLALGDQPLFAPIGTLLNDALAAALQVANLYWAHCIGSGQWGQLCSQPPIVGPYWSLSLEEQFYLLLPLLMILLPARRLLALVVLVIVAHALWDRPIFSLAWYVRPDSLLWGVLLALLGQRIARSGLPARLAAVPGRSLLSILLLAALAWLPVNGAEFLAGVSTVAVVALVSALLVWLAACGAGIEPGAFLLWMGSRSYALYLVHYPLYVLAQLLLFPAAGSSGSELALYAFCALGMIGLAAEATYRLVEMPLRNYGRGLSMQVSRRSAAQPV